MEDNRGRLDIVAIMRREQTAPSVAVVSVLPAAWFGPALRKTAVAVAGFAVLAIGISFIFLPAPSVVVIPLGLAILAREFRWARRLLDWSRDRARRWWNAVLDQLGSLPH